MTDGPRTRDRHGERRSCQRHVDGARPIRVGGKHFEQDQSKEQQEHDAIDMPPFADCVDPTPRTPYRTHTARLRSAHIEPTALVTALSWRAAGGRDPRRASARRWRPSGRRSPA